MLTGKLPCGANVARCHSKKAQGKLQYQTILDDACEMPVWFDGVLQKSVHIDPRKRYTESSEFIYDLRH